MTPDLAQAAAFLKLLDPDATSFTFQTFDDDSARKDNRLARVFHGTLADHADSLTDLQSRGAGVFITINATDGTGRKAENITRVRALWLDLDGAPIQPVREWETPHIEVESSPGKWHAYWLVNDVALEQFTQLQAALIKKFDGDPAVKDLPRVMRLPGFWHLKPGSAPHMSRVVHTSTDGAGDFYKRLKVEAPVMPAPRRDTPASLAEVEELLTYISPDLESDHKGGDKYWHTIIAAIVDVSGGSDDGLQVADAWSSRSRHYDPKELRKRFESFTPGKEGGSGMGTIIYHAKQAGANVAGIGARHRLLNMPGPSHVPAGMMPDAPVQGMPIAARADSVVDLICAKIQENPTVAVELLADEVARLSPADRDKVLAECKPHGIKTEMQAAVKRAINAYTIAKSAVTAAGVSAGPLSFYFIIENEFGQPVVMDRRGGMQPQSRVAFRDAKAALPTVMIIDPSSGNVRAKSAADHWWEDHETPRYDATGYDPLVGLEYTDNKGRKIRNVYQPGHDTPAAPVGPEAIEPFLYVMRSNFPNTEDQEILLQYMAHVIQFPGIQTRWAPVMQGTQGCGKGTISQAVTYCHGRANVAHPSTDVIATDFNGYMHRKTFIVVNEIGDHSKRELSAMSEKIKPWVTDDPVHIHDKGKGSRDTQNFTNWIFTTNHLHCMLATPGERRYAHFISALQTEADASQAFYPSWWTEGDDWWGSYYDWWGAGGAEAVRGYLTHMVVAQTPSRAPVTSSTADAMKAGDGAALSLIREAITEGGSGFRGGWVSLNAVRDLLDAEDVKMPAGQFLARQLEQIGYRHSTRCHTSPSEANRFPKAPNRSRIYHVENKPDTDPQGVMALYDAAQRLGDGGPVRSSVVKMPGI